jgi:hypothetical protein
VELASSSTAIGSTPPRWSVTGARALRSRTRTRASPGWSRRRGAALKCGRLACHAFRLGAGGNPNCPRCVIIGAWPVMDLRASFRMVHGIYAQHQGPYIQDELMYALLTLGPWLRCGMDMVVLPDVLLSSG